MSQIYHDLAKSQFALAEVCRARGGEVRTRGAR